MKRSLAICSVVLICGISSPAASARPENSPDQESSTRPRRAAISDNGFLGVNLDEVTSSVASRLKLRQERGALITSVIGDTGAARAGLQKDDVVVKWNDEPVESARQLSRHIRETPPGRTVRLGIIRNGREETVTVTLGDKPGNLGRTREGVGTVYRTRPAREVFAPRPPRADVQVVGRRYRMGVSLQSMSPQLAL